LKAGVSYGFKLPKMTDISLRYDAEGRSGFINQSASVKAAGASDPYVDALTR
jgi:subtilase-type serine protease